MVAAQKVRASLVVGLALCRTSGDLWVERRIDGRPQSGTAAESLLRSWSDLGVSLVGTGMLCGNGYGLIWTLSWLARGCPAGSPMAMG